MTTLLIGLFGGLGAVSRFVVDGEVRSRVAGWLPWATLAVNLAGSLLLGWLVGSDVSEQVRLVLGVGFCGGFTTFSTASLETVRLAADQHPGRALSYLALTVVGCLSAAWLGLHLG